MGRVIDLEDGAGVVAEAPDQAEIEDDALGDPRLSRPSSVRMPLPRLLERPAELVSTSAPPRIRGTRSSSSASASLSWQTGSSCSTPTKSPAASSARMRSRLAGSTPS